MVTLQKAAEQALAAIKSANQVNYSWACVEAVAVLEAALAEPNKCTHGVTDGNCKECYMAESEQEPVAWMDREGDLYKMPEIKNWAPPHTMLYTAPPQRKPLTEEQNFCPRCGKRNGPSPYIHTCTPPADSWAYPTNNIAP